MQTTTKEEKKKEEEYDDDDIDDFRAPPGLSHARPRRGLLRDDVNDDSDDDSYETDEEGEEEENLDRFFSACITSTFSGKDSSGKFPRAWRTRSSCYSRFGCRGFTPLRGLAVFKNGVRGTRSDCDIMRDCVVIVTR